MSIKPLADVSKSATPHAFGPQAVLPIGPEERCGGPQRQIIGRAEAGERDTELFAGVGRILRVTRLS